MARPNTLPFEYLVRGAPLEYLHGPDHGQAVEQRDVELEDFLGRLVDRIAKLEARIVALGG